MKNISVASNILNPNLRVNIKIRKISLACLVVCGAVASMTSLDVFAASGKFTYVTGPVFIETNGRRVPATNGSEVNPGDIIIAEADGMAQLAMIDQAKLSLRSNSRLRIDSYQKKVGDQDGAVLSLLRGTMRTFTGLLTSANREKYQMKTRVATVGIRGSGNILSHEEDDNGANPVSINHTIEGSHVVSSVDGKFSPIFTFPNDTVKVVFGKPPEKIPTPPSIMSASNTMVSKREQKATTEIPASNPATNVATGNPQSGTGGGNSGAGGTGGGITTPNILPPVIALPDPTGLRDIVLAGSNSTYSGQASPQGTTLDGQNLRGFTSASGGFGAAATITGGTIADAATVSIGSGSSITFGRWNAP
ncbi:MAG: hypothetical protein HC782_04205, partial [Gammaproteobacteria bacterium]|nr:hypothetical protein [Gammaproteobacteria bacterium]